MKRRSLVMQALALTLALVSFTLLNFASRDTGFVRDEAAYAESSLRIRSWLSTVAASPKKAIAQKDRAFRYNREHPAGTKLLAAMVIADQGKVRKTIPGQRLRLPAQFIAAMGVYLLALVAMRRYGLSIGLFCAAAFIALPRVFYHAQLHCFDIAIAVLGFVVAQAFMRFVQKPSYARSLALGLSFGLALSVKHNALLLPLFLTLPLAWCYLDQRLPRAQLGRVLLRGALALLLGAGLFVLLWPWLWSDPWHRWLEYIDFHREHSYYNMAFWGHNYNQPPLPIAYPWVLTALTWPFAWLLLALWGMLIALFRPGRDQASLEARSDLVLALAPLILISLPSVPIFGGTKHWMTAYPFMCLLMGRALFSLRKGVALGSAPKSRVIVATGLGLLVSPALVDNLRSHPHQLAQYASWAGGPRAAARMGMGRLFWGGLCVPQSLAKIGAQDPTDPSSLFPHDMHHSLLGAYRAQGMADNLEVSRRKGSDWALSFHEAHQVIDEIWTQRAGFGPVPHWVCTLDDVPLMSLYRRSDPEAP